MSELDPITGTDPSTLTVATLAERLAMERALREQGYGFHERALQLQAKEYERRLSELNHAQELAVAVQARTVPRELFEQYVREAQAKVDVRFDGLDSRIDALNESEIRRGTDEKNREIRETRERATVEQRTSRQQWSVGIIVLIASLLINIVLRLLNVGG